MAFYQDMGKWKDHTACIDSKGNSLTYEELEKEAEILGNTIGERTLVFSYCENAIGSILGYVSFLKHRVVPVLLAADLEKELRESLLRLYQPSYLYVPNRMKKEFELCESVWEKFDYCLLRTKYSKKVEMYSELALLLTTSGSTGSPKLVRQSYQNIQSNAAAIAEYLELNAMERPITTLPMNYTYGLSIINSHFFVGAKLLITENTLLEREFWDFFRREKATSFGGVPYTYEILKKLKFFEMDLPSLKTMTQAGGKLSPELHLEYAEYAEKHQKHFVIMYGQTEATARMAYLPWEKAITKYGSMGIAIPGGKLWLKTPEGHKIDQPEVVGELVYEGENVTLGYAECREDLVQGDLRQGRLETGDMAKMDQDGYFYIVGRKKRFLKIFGNRVNLDETERIVKQKYPELDCACAGVDDKLYLFMTERMYEKEIKTLLSEKLGLHPSAFHIVWIKEIPKNNAGKILYKKLEKYYGGL
ncbi:MAG: AMP-binding protein [Lachnospiraceae bacterium]|nr:AMP-binding protein [Lachnospiraceae bacterium]